MLQLAPNTLTCSVMRDRPVKVSFFGLPFLGRVLPPALDLLTILAAARLIYGSAFNPQITLKALSYYDDGDLNGLPPSLQKRLKAAVLSVTMAKFSERLSGLQS